MFLSEPQSYQSNVHLLMEQISHDYCFSLNSDDLYDPALPLYHSRTHGGTMILWKKSLDPFVQLLPPKSSSFLAIILSMPHLPPSIHYSVYLPTSGKDNEYIEELSQLKLSIEEVLEKYDDPLIYIRGDANTNLKIENRLVLF